MHLLVTDRLCCVRCGPSFGLILLADELVERRVLRGALGCANCRERYPVERGFGDFRPLRERAASSNDATAPAHTPGDDPEEALRLAAMLGVKEGPGLLLLVGPTAAQASRVAAIVEGIEVVALDPALRGDEETPGVSRIDAGARLPFFTGSLRGVAVRGAVGDVELSEAVRVLGPGARLVLRGPEVGAVARLEALGLTLLLETRKALVAVRE